MRSSVLPVVAPCCMDAQPADASRTGRSASRACVLIALPPPPARRHFAPQPLEPEIGKLGTRRIARRRVAARELVVRRARVLELFLSERDAGRRSFARERL